MSLLERELLRGGVVCSWNKIQVKIVILTMFSFMELWNFLPILVLD